MPAVPQLLVVVEAGRPRAVASSGVGFEIEEAALRVAARFGPPSDSVFVVDLAGRPAVVQADAAGFRFLLTAADDPFALAAAGPVPPRPRTLEDLQAVLKSGDGPLLLGAAQAVLDGGRVRLADPADVPKVWALLPDSTRAEVRPATFAVDDSLGFHLSAGPPVAAAGLLTADQCRDYPEGRYELALQAAVEAGDRREVARLLARRSSRETLKLAATMVGLAVGGAVLLKLIG